MRQQVVDQRPVPAQAHAGQLLPALAKLVLLRLAGQLVLEGAQLRRRRARITEGRGKTQAVGAALGRL